MFVDQGLRLLREQVARDGKGLPVTTYGTFRGFINVAPGSVSPSNICLAATTWVAVGDLHAAFSDARQFRGLAPRLVTDDAGVERPRSM
jgi:hypothetical protein